jgi:hypothetical protein
MSGETIDLISPIQKLRLCLEPPALQQGPHGMLREVPGTRKQVRFEGGRARIPIEWLPLLEVDPRYTGVGHKKIVFRADDANATFSLSNGVQVVSGPISSTTASRQPAPLPGWDDTMSNAEIKRAISAGRVEDLHGAVLHELTHRRREVVLRALYTRLAAGKQEAPIEPPAAEADQGPQATTATVPAGEGTVI